MVRSFTIDEYWKNFDLGKEIHFSGAFIYNALNTFHQMQNFYHEDPIFEFLYSLAVGIERLQKVVIILREHDRIDDHEVFEESLITHSHLKLADKIEQSTDVSLPAQQKEFLALLAKFYKTYRYSRFVVGQTTDFEKEREMLISFLEKHLSLKIDNQEIFVTQNDERFKKFIGRLVSKICIPLYTDVKSQARRMNLYTYELRYGSKAFKIFQMEKFDFLDEDILTRELLLYFVATTQRGANSKLMSETKPLTFDPALEGEYVQALMSNSKKIYVMEELEHLYLEEISDFKERLNLLNAISSEHLYLSRNNGDDELDEDEFS